MSRKSKKDDKDTQADERADSPQAPPDQAQAPPAAERDVEALQADRDDLLDRLQRVSADYLNYQKRVQRDIQLAREFANDELIKSLLGVLDDMERALAAARQAGHDEDDPFLRGMQLVHDKAIETLGRFGLAVIKAEGKPFDPDLHAAMMQQPCEDRPPKTVLKEVVRGYRLKGRTLRPSGVVVSAPPEDDRDEAADAEGERETDNDTGEDAR